LGLDGACLAKAGGFNRGSKRGTKTSKGKIVYSRIKAYSRRTEALILAAKLEVKTGGVVVSGPREEKKRNSMVRNFYRAFLWGYLEDPPP